MKEYVGRLGVEEILKLIRGELDSIQDWISFVASFTVGSNIRVSLDTGCILMDVPENYRGPDVILTEKGYLEVHNNG